MSLRDALLPAIDAIRGIPDSLGIRQWRVFLVVTTSTGGRIGQGIDTVTTTELLLADGKRPKVRSLRSADVISSGGVLQTATFEIGPLTPEYSGGGLDLDLFDPSVASSGRQVLFRITGYGLPADGVLCKRIDDDTTKPFSNFLRVQRIGR